jgi:hypothetical protein
MTLVTCIMPTANRRNFVPSAIACFQSQDYAERELVILDDGEDSVRDLVPVNDPRIRYHRLDSKLPLGAKRNQCIEAARGDLILHWDDDDWMSSWRIRYQVDSMLAARVEICGLRRLLFHEPATGIGWLYDYPSDRRFWLAGGTLLYTRSLWRKRPFPEIGCGEDTRFVWDLGGFRGMELSDRRFYVATIHPGNTSPKYCQGSYWTPATAEVLSVLGQTFTVESSSGQGTPRIPSTAASVSLTAPSPNCIRPNELNLNLGCCDQHLPNFINVDCVASSNPDVCADLTQPWPWQDNTIGYVRAWDIIEHLPDKIFTMNELWRVLRPGGHAEIAVPTTDGSGAFQDPTHISFWNRNSFLYYQDGHPYRNRLHGFYGIHARFRVVREKTTQSQDGPRLTILLEAVKP